jgi:hypothetical protein
LGGKGTACGGFLRSEFRIAELRVEEGKIHSLVTSDGAVRDLERNRKMSSFETVLFCRSEIIQWRGDNFFEIIRLTETMCKVDKDRSLVLTRKYVVMDEKNPEVRAVIPMNGWVIKDVLGNFEILDDVAFRLKYRIVAEESEGGEREGGGDDASETG